MTPLAELFPAGDYRFHLTLRRDEPRDFFRPHDASGRTLAERARWLEADPKRYADLLPEGAPVLAEFSELAAEWLGRSGLRPDHERSADAAGQVRDLTYSAADMRSIGKTLEPDVLLLSPDAGGKFCLRGGALCFPTGWALEEKIGHPMDFIHGVVPGLNTALASPIHQFLTRLKPGQAFLRDNWGLAATDELNLHPARKMPPPALPVALDRLWLRVEHQALVALPRTGGVAFGIRIVSHRLDAVARDREAAAGLRRALETMPTDLAAYKRIDHVRAEVIRMLSEARL